MKAILWTGLGVILLILVLILVVVLFVRSPFPNLRGTVRLDGLSERVEVLRDEDGVPHVFAQDVEDMLFAEGYVHAQDRFWQMEFWRRTGAGRLSEIFGKDLVETDRFLKTMGFARVAQTEYARMPEPYKTYLEAYAAGVNAYLHSRRASRLGLEFALLGLQGVKWEIEDWSPVDSLTWAKMMAYDLCENMGGEVFNLDVLKSGGLSLLEVFLTPYRQDMPYIVSTEELEQFRAYWGIDASEAATAGVQYSAGRDGAGSNNWIVGPSLTESGHPLVANDMHLSAQMPSIWYEIGLHSADGIDLRGYSFAGTPGLIAGQNAHIAWGLTNVGGDVQDYFVERLDPKDPDRYWDNGQWRDMDVRFEPIYVQGQDKPVYHKVRQTVRGPLVSDLKGFEKLMGWKPDPAGEGPERVGITATSLSWTALEPSTIFQSIFDINRADTFQEFRDALRLWDVPGQNLVYADDLGNIVYQTTGRYPIRSGHDGQAPGLGYEGERWTGDIPFDLLPGIVNPPKGYIVTANNPVASPDYGFLIGTSFVNGYRARRIAERIEGFGGGITPEDIRDIHADVYSLHADEVLRAFAAIDLEIAYTQWVARETRLRNPQSEPFERDLEKDLEFLAEGVRILEDWDRNMDAESAGAAAFSYVWLQLVRDIIEDEVLPGRSIPGAVGTYEEVLIYLLGEPDHPLWNLKYTEGTESAVDTVGPALVQGLMEARDALGAKPSRWKWGKVHTITFENGSLGKSGIALIERIFNRGPYPANGSANTVNVAHWRFSDPFAVTLTVSERSIMDPVDPSASVFIHPTGQSGHPFNRHYDDFIDDWLNVTYHPSRWTYEEAKASARGRRLILVPEQL